MRSAGKWIGKLRRVSSDLRAQSGIDDLIRQEGLEREIHELRSLSRVNVIDTLMAPALASTAATTAAVATTPRAPAPAPAPHPKVEERIAQPLREREYPLIGCDAYGALPDDAAPYTGSEALS